MAKPVRRGGTKVPVARARGEEQRIGLSALKVSRDLAISGYRISLNTRFAAQIEYRMWFRWKPWPMGLASEKEYYHLFRQQVCSKVVLRIRVVANLRRASNARSTNGNLAIGLQLALDVSGNGCGHVCVKVGDRLRGC